MKEAAKALKKVKDTDVLSPFFLYLFLSQLYASLQRRGKKLNKTIEMIETVLL